MDRKRMFFKRSDKRSRSERGSASRAAAPLSPRFERLVRESWWLLVVAAFLWLALVLATYAKTDQSFSFSGAHSAMTNRGGVAGAWISDLLLKLFGFSTWWWVVAGEM